MLTVTEKAAKYMREILSSRSEGSQQVLRIIFRDGNYELTLDDPREDDHVFEQDGETYLLVEPDVAEALSEATIDAQETTEGTRLTLTTGSGD